MNKRFPNWKQITEWNVNPRWHWDTKTNFTAIVVNRLGESKEFYVTKEESKLWILKQNIVTNDSSNQEVITLEERDV